MRLMCQRRPVPSISLLNGLISSSMSSSTRVIWRRKRASLCHSYVIVKLPKSLRASLALSTSSLSHFSQLSAKSCPNASSLSWMRWKTVKGGKLSLRQTHSVRFTSKRPQNSAMPQSELNVTVPLILKTKNNAPLTLPKFEIPRISVRILSSTKALKFQIKWSKICKNATH